jgi:hypothetical protein
VVGGLAPAGLEKAVVLECGSHANIVAGLH